MQQITVGGVRVAIVRKPIKNLHLGVYPPRGRVRVAAPLSVSNEAVRLAVIGKLAWIKRQRTQFASQPRQSRREMVNGESHYFQGRRYRLRVVEQREKRGFGRIFLRNLSLMELHVQPGTNADERERIMQRWYRARLRESIPALLATWEATLGVRVTAWGIKKMKTKWGACNPEAGRIWLNLELAKKAPRCLEYVVVHELVHLLVRHHDDQFSALMDRHLPTWRARRQELNSAPLVQETWTH